MVPRPITYISGITSLEQGYGVFVVQQCSLTKCILIHSFGQNRKSEYQVTLMTF